jgi:hypothetical protein
MNIREKVEHARKWQYPIRVTYENGRVNIGTVDEVASRDASLAQIISIQPMLDEPHDIASERWEATDYRIVRRQKQSPMVSVLVERRNATDAQMKLMAAAPEITDKAIRFVERLRDRGADTREECEALIQALRDGTGKRIASIDWSE